MQCGSSASRVVSSAQQSEVPSKEEETSLSLSLPPSASPLAQGARARDDRCAGASADIGVPGAADRAGDLLESGLKKKKGILLSTLKTSESRSATPCNDSAQAMACGRCPHRGSGLGHDSAQDPATIISPPDPLTLRCSY